MGLDCGQVGVEGCVVEKVPFVAATSGVANHASGASSQRDGPVPKELKPPQQQQRKQVAEVQAVGGRVKAAVDHHRTGIEKGGKFFLIGGVVDQASSRQIRQNR